MIRQAAPVTIQLALAALLVALLGIPLGVYSAVRQYTVRDMTLTSVSLVFWGVPVFVLGPLLLWLFSFKLGWLPFEGAGETTLGIVPAAGRACGRSSSPR